MEYSGGSEVEREIGDTASPPPLPCPCDNWLQPQGEKAAPLSNSLSSLVSSTAVDRQTFTARLRTMESVLYNNNLLPKAQKNKAGEKLSALF